MHALLHETWLPNEMKEIIWSYTLSNNFGFEKLEVRTILHNPGVFHAHI